MHCRSRAIGHLHKHPLHRFPEPTSLLTCNVELPQQQADMAEPHEHEFLSLEDARPPFSTGEEPAASPFDTSTLWTEFARSHPRLSSPPRTPPHRVEGPNASAGNTVERARPTIDLRSLEYVSEYDSNLMCPICHVPLIEPVVLDCDHTFCQECFEVYRTGRPSADGPRCPACRSYLLGGCRKASRLIKNMCNDIQVRCPNDGCDIVTARGYVEQHATRECPEQEMPCPDTICPRKTKRKNFVPDQCIHSSHIECECGASIRLGRGEWIKHKDSECPNTTISTPAQGTTVQGHQDKDAPSKCPGADFGCTNPYEPNEHEAHIKICPLARLAPALTKQAQLLHTLSDQLKMTKMRNDALETGFDRLTSLITTTIEPKLNRLNDTIETNQTSDIEEIQRDDDFTHRQTFSLLPSETHMPLSTTTQTTAYTTAYNDLHPRLTTLESQTSTLQSHLSDLDARSSMALMNETLRIREELAQINGAVYSTRAQVQWLLNRERMLGQREAMMGQRGRVGAPGPSTSAVQGGQSAAGSSMAGADRSGTQAVQSTQTTGGGGGGSGTTSTQRPSMDRNMSSAWSSISQAVAGTTSGPSSAATSPMFSATRPSLRRLSGGSSQERVKL